MFSIGEFSKITRLSVKTLRYYHERSLLIPASIESGTGYRYYNQSNVERARVIVELRSLGFSLSVIDDILKGCTDDSQLMEHLEKRKSVTVQEIDRQQKIATTLDAIIFSVKQSRTVMQNLTREIVEKELEPILVAGIRMNGQYSDCGQGFSKLFRAFGRFVNGKPLCLFYDEGYRESDANFEPCVPIKKLIEREGIDVREIPGTRCLSMIHQGPYDEASECYESLIAYARDKGYALQIPCREIYIKGPGMIFKGNPQKYITEIQMPFELGDA